MYLLWKYPGADDPAGFWSRSMILARLEHSTADWAQRLGISIRTKIKKHGFVLTFDNESDFTLFALSWKPPSAENPDWFQYEVKEPMRVDRYR